jgi:hypothetical protein
MKQDSHVVLQIADCMTTYYMSTKSGRKSQKEPKRAKKSLKTGIGVAEGSQPAGLWNELFQNLKIGRFNTVDPFFLLSWRLLL